MKYKSTTRAQSEIRSDLKEEIDTFKAKASTNRTVKRNLSTNTHPKRRKRRVHSNSP
jgi:hypothetical protein